jgi:hypothetical protein
MSAARVWVMQDERSANVVFADSLDDPAACIAISRELRPGDLSRRLGMDGVYLEINGKECAAWRAASGYTFDGRELRIVVAQAALAKLDLTGDLWIELAEPGMDTDELRAALAAIFADEQD